MGLKLEEKWIWDLWLAKDGPDYHVYYLQAPRALSNPELRHRNVSIGHAVSGDLRQWEVLPDAMKPATEEGAWDDYTTWTGSVIKHQGLWFMFYTGGTRAENALIQRIGFATSKDLIHWERHTDNPVIQHDPTRYESYDPDLWHDHTWRDPWVMRDPESELFHAFITARVKDGPTDGRGVIALAQSSDLCNWEVLDPVTAPGDFGYMEVPQVERIKDAYFLFFSTVKNFHSELRRERTAAESVTGIHYLVAEKISGPYQTLTDEFLLGDTNGTYYGSKTVLDPAGQRVLLPMRYLNEHGEFIGDMGDPIQLTIGSEGGLFLEDNQ
jgi:beta-fructofuranosidase